MKTKRLQPFSPTTDTSSPRRSKRLREAEELRRLQPNSAIPSKSNSHGAESTKKFSRKGTFPLAALLSLEVPTRDHLLPHLSPDDLSALELVNVGSLQTIRAKRYWKPALSRFVKSDAIAGKIYQKCNQGRSNEVPTTSRVPNVATTDPRFHQRLYLKVKAHKRRLEKNIRRGAYKESAVFLPTESNSVTTDASSKFVFVAGDNQVDVFEIAETSNGASLKLQYHLNWEGKLSDYNGVRNGASHAYIIKCHGDLLFIAHYSGLVSVWNWKDQSLAHRIRYHAIANDDLLQMPVFVAMECKQNRLMLGHWADQPVTVWKFDETNPSSAALISEIRLQGYGEVKAIDFDAHLAVVAFDRSASNIHHVCIWDLSKNAVSRFITSPHVQTLDINAASDRLLIGSTRVYIGAPVLQMFSLQDGRALISYQTEDVKTWFPNVDFDEDFFLEGATSVWTDWSERVILGFTNGVIAFYDINDQKPIKCLQRTLPDYDSPRWINDLCFDGAYLVFAQETDVCLFDFLKIHPSKL